MLNVVAIMGRLARDPEMRQTTTGKNVASFRIACDRGRRDANGQSVADWIDVVAWDRQAELNLVWIMFPAHHSVYRLQDWQQLRQQSLKKMHNLFM